jgi:hypothetical protein
MSSSFRPDQRRYLIFNPRVRGSILRGPTALTCRNGASATWSGAVIRAPTDTSGNGSLPDASDPDTRPEHQGTCPAHEAVADVDEPTSYSWVPATTRPMTPPKNPNAHHHRSLRLLYGKLSPALTAGRPLRRRRTKACNRGRSLASAALIRVDEGAAVSEWPLQLLGGGGGRSA